MVSSLLLLIIEGFIMVKMHECIMEKAVTAVSQVLIDPKVFKKYPFLGKKLFLFP